MANGGGSVAFEENQLGAKSTRKTYYQRVDEILKSVDSVFFNKFGQLKSDPERFEFVYSTEVIRKSLKNYVLGVESLDYVKNEELAKACRLRGNEHFKSKEFNVALKFYNECIRNARFPLHFEHGFNVEHCGYTKNYETPDKFTNNETTNKQTSVIHESKQCCRETTENSAASSDLENASELALGLANRSAVMLKLNRYTDCIEDALLAINCSYPSQQKYKLWERMATCHEQMGRWKEAEVDYRNFEESLDCSDLSEGPKMSNRKTALDGIARCKAHIMKEVDKNDFKGIIDSLNAGNANQQINFDNSNFKNATDCKNSSRNGFSASEIPRPNGLKFNCQDTRHFCLLDTGLNSIEKNVDAMKDSFPLPPASTSSVKFCYSKDLGRFASASRDIKTGEVVLIDKTFAKVLDPTLIGRRCQHCFVRLYPDVDRMFPCPSCRSVTYCSEKCARLSKTLDRHDLECPILQDLQLSQTGTLANLVTKLLFNVGAKKWTDIANSSGASSGCDMTNSDVFTRRLAVDHSRQTETTLNENVSQEALVLYHLLSHSDKRSSMELLQFTILAVWVVILINEKTPFFSEQQEKHNPTSAERPSLQSQQNCSQIAASAVAKNLADPVVVIGGIVLRFLQIITCNGIEISETIVRKVLGECHPNPIGLALYPAASLFNHSCDPDLEFIFDRDVCYARCIRAVHAGFSISVDYGYLFYVTNRDERMQSLLKQYFFNCQCLACKNHWPVKSKLKKDLVALPKNNRASDVKQCSVQCPVCQNQLTEMVENKNITMGKPGIVLLDKESKNNEETKLTKRKKKKKPKSNVFNFSAETSDDDLNGIECCPGPCQNGDINSNNSLCISNCYKCSNCGIISDEAAILEIQKFDPKLTLEQILMDVRQLKVSAHALRYLELYLDYRYFNFSSTPTYEMITCLSTLKQCYRLFGNTSC